MILSFDSLKILIEIDFINFIKSLKFNKKYGFAKAFFIKN